MVLAIIPLRWRTWKPRKMKEVLYKSSTVSLTKFLIEVVIGHINLFLQHYDSPSTLGKKLAISIQCLQLEAGMDVMPHLNPMPPNWVTHHYILGLLFLAST